MTIDTTLEVLSKKIEEAEKIVLLSHLNPDADTMCSAAAFYDVLFRKQKKIVHFNASDEIATAMKKISYSEKLQSTFPEKFDLAISFDCGSFKRLGIEKFSQDLINIDHHISNEKYGTINIVKPEKVSTTQVVYDLLKQLNWKISPIAAQLLFTGLVSDSLSFGTDRVDSAVFAMASDLIELGASPQKAREALYEQNSLARMRLAALMMKSLSLHVDGQFAIVHATQEMFEETGAQRSDTEEALRMIMSMGVVTTALILRVELNGQLKGSLRTKTEVNVSHIASKYGGGGHVRASGFETEKSIDEIKKEMIEIFEKELR